MPHKPLDVRTLVLPTRKPKGHIGNYMRSRIVQCANHQNKVAQMSDAWKSRHAQEGCTMCEFVVHYKQAWKVN